MKSMLAAEWRVLRRGSPGRRFAESYRVSHTVDGRATMVRRLIRLALALISFVIGVVLVFLPGPAVLFFAVTGALLATESKSIARLLDWTEVRLRAAGRWAKRRWQALPPWGKVVVGTLVVGLTLGLGVVAYRVVMR